jgi:hypothetical protein
MSSPAAPLHAAKEAALRGSAALAAAMGGQVRLYPAEVPPNAPLPYIVAGDDEILLENTDCAAEAEVVATVQWWSRTSPPDKGAQARAIGGAIVAALNAALTLAGWDVDEWEVQSESYSTDPDQSTRGRAVFRYLLTEQAA